jgi:putative ABC transport system permease protein
MPVLRGFHFGLIAGFFRGILAMAEGLAIVSAIAIMLVAANTAAMSIRERRNEIAVMRALGFRGGTILASLLAESLTMGLAGAIAGCGLGWAALRLVGLGSSALGPIAFALHLSSSVVVETLLAGSAIGLGAALVPASTQRARISSTLSAPFNENAQTRSGAFSHFSKLRTGL